MTIGVEEQLPLENDSISSFFPAGPLMMGGDRCLYLLEFLPFKQ